LGKLSHAGELPDARPDDRTVRLEMWAPLCSGARTKNADLFKQSGAENSKRIAQSARHLAVEDHEGGAGEGEADAEHLAAPDRPVSDPLAISAKLSLERHRSV
jgi:hypothetical protein